jgi:hypothetical protein
MPNNLPAVRRPEAVFRREEDLRGFCSAAADRLTDYAVDVDLAAAQMQKLLGQIPDGTLVGITSKIKAQLVMAHLKVAARVLDAAAGYSAGAWSAYCKAFAKERDEYRASKTGGTP